MSSISNTLNGVWRALIRRRKSFASLERWAQGLSPSDRFVIGALTFLMFVSTGAMLAEASRTFSVEVPAPGGTYTEGIAGSPRFVNPLLAISEADQDLTALVYSGLMRRTADGALSPDLAESYVVSDDGLTYTFVLRPESMFQNGTPVTADDVAFTVRNAQNPAVKSPLRANWDGVTVNVIDQKTISFTLKTPYAPFIENTTLGILPLRLWQDVSVDEFPFSTLNTNPVGSGPYRVSEVHRSSSGIPTEYRLTAFRGGARSPYIDTIILKLYQDTEELQSALSSGLVDAAHSVTPESARGRTRVLEGILGRVFAVFFNQNQNKFFADSTVRKALEEAIDKKAIVDTILGGYGSVIDEPLPPSSVSASVDNRTAAERLESARTLLTNAGWTLGEDGVLVKKTKRETTRLSFSLSTANVPELKRVAEMVAADWKTLGAEVELKFFEQNDLSTEVLRPRKYDALLFGLVVGDDADLFAFWHSSQRNDPGLNVALYASIDVDKKLESARIESDIKKRREIAHSVANTIRTETAAIFLYTPHFVYLVPKNLEGAGLGIIVTPSDRFANVSEWSLSREFVWPFFVKK